MSKRPELSPEQQKVVDCWGQGMAVIAGAGSGKTTTLVVKCLELLKRNPQARFAAVSFTERSASDLREKLTQKLFEDGHDGLTGHWVMTIHGLCGAILREFPRQAGFDGEERVLSELEARTLWEQAVEGLWFDDLAPEMENALERILSREGRTGLESLLLRIRELQHFGLLDALSADGTKDPDLGALYLLGIRVLDRYERLKKRRGALDFNDLEAGAHRALDHEEVRRAFHRRFDLVLVDEFQDTNPVQARILTRLVRPDFSNLCVVGDPKQSIYRFRDADVSVFEDFCSKLPVNLLLTWNFRSRPGIIDFSNQICAPLFEASALRYDPLIPKRDPDPALEPCVRLRVQSPQELALWLLAENQKGVGFGKFALLLRRVRGSQKWLRALSAQGIPIVLGSGGLFWEDPRVREWVSFLKWWDSPGNELSGAIFLRAPWLGLSDAVLDQWRREKKDLRQEFLKSDHPVAQVLREFVGKIVRPGEILERFLEIPNLEQELGSQLLGLWHRSEDLSSKGMSFSAVVSEFSRSIEEKRRERDVPPPADGDDQAGGQVLVLTLHSSKGLEFDHVILVDFEKPVVNRDIPLLFWDRNRGVFLGKRTATGDRDRKDPVEKEWRAWEIEQRVAESKRVFYVAATRARERLVLVTPSEISDVPDDSRKQDFWGGWLEQGGVFLPEVKLDLPVSAKFEWAATDRTGGEQAASPRRRAAALGLRRARHSVTEWLWLDQCSLAYEWRVLRPPQVEGLLPQIRQRAELGLSAAKDLRSEGEGEGLLSTRELGTRVHECLELGNYDELEALEREVGSDRLNAKKIRSWAESSAWMQGHQPELGRWVWSELAFELEIQDEVLVGAMDRVILEERSDAAREPFFTILDFKVSAQEKTPHELLKRYGTQMVWYAYALGRLDSRAWGRTRAHLVQISSQGVVTVEVPLPDSPQSNESNELQAWAEAQAFKVARVIRGERGTASPSELCGVCEFRKICPS